MPRKKRAGKSSGEENEIAKIGGRALAAGRSSPKKDGPERQGIISRRVEGSGSPHLGGGGQKRSLNVTEYEKTMGEDSD